jgi:hypothetical protein
MDAGDIVLIVAGILSFLFFAVITIVTVAFAVYYWREKDDRLDYSWLSQKQEEVLFELDILSKEVLVVVILLIVGVGWSLFVADMIRIPLTIVFLGLIQILVIIYIERKIRKRQRR